MTFEELNLAPALLKAVLEHGYDTPTPIQAQAIPAVLAGGDLLGGAQTGTGKTAAFTLPLLQRLSTEPRLTNRRGVNAVRALIMTPTRELAAQVEESVRTYGKYLDLTSMVMFGGVGMGAQIEKLRRGVDILVATPGRLLDHAGQGTLDLSQVQILVLDEADRMLDMGFIHDIKKILGMIPKQRQTLFFSATMPPEIEKLANTMLINPVRIEVAVVSSTAEKIEQHLMYVDKSQKKDLLRHILNDPKATRVIVFTRTKHGANKVTELLVKNKVSSEAIHGNKSQNARQRALDTFKDGKTRVLIATDIAARGIDVDGITHVINYEIPNISESYVHRIGRTARAGHSGIAISLCDNEEKAFIKDIEKLIGKKIPVDRSHPYHSDAVENAALISKGKAKAMVERATGGKRLNIGYGGPRRSGGSAGGGAGGSASGAPKKKRYFTGFGK